MGSFCDQTAPDLERSRRVLSIGQKGERRRVGLGCVGQNLIEQHVNVRVAMPYTRHRKGSQLRVHHQRAVNLRVRFRQTLLAKKKIAIFPGHFGGYRVASLGGSEITVRFVIVPRRLERTCQIELVIRGARIELYRAPVIGNGQGKVRIIKIELAETSQAVPDLRVVRLETRGAFPVFGV